MYLGALIARNINDQNATNIDLQHNSYKKNNQFILEHATGP